MIVQTAPAGSSLLDKIAEKDRPLADKMLNGELDRQKSLKAELAKNSETAGWLDERKLFQNYKQLQFLDTLALYFNRIHLSQRGEQDFENVPVNAGQDVTITIRPAGTNVYSLSPFPFAASGAEYAFAGRRIEPDLAVALAVGPRRSSGLRRYGSAFSSWRAESVSSMLEIDIPEVLALTEAFEAYEWALIDNDIAAVNELFWHSPDAVRFGARDFERQYGYAEIAEFRLRRGPVDQRRTLHNRHITTFGSNFGVANVEYVPVGSSKIGRQSQTWMRTEGGWKIVSAHVSFGVCA